MSLAHGPPPEAYGGFYLEAMDAHNPAWTMTSYWYADGWLVRPAGGDANWWHNGSLPGTSTLMQRKDRP